jgi:hypothetical protein
MWEEWEFVAVSATTVKAVNALYMGRLCGEDRRVNDRDV